MTAARPRTDRPGVVGSLPIIESSIDRRALGHRGIVPLEAVRDDGFTDSRRHRALRRDGLVSIRRWCSGTPRPIYDVRQRSPAR